MENNTGYAKFGLRVGYVISAHIVIIFLNVIQIPLLTKGLGPDLYGIWALISVTIALIAPLAVLGLGNAVVRFLAGDTDRDKVSEDFLSVLGAVFIAGLILMFLLLLSSDYLASIIFKNVNSSVYIKLASVLVILNSMRLITLVFYRTRMKMGLYTVLDLGWNVLQFGLMMAAVLLGYELTGVIVAVVASGAILFVVNLLIILRQVGFRLPHFSNIKAYLRWGLPLIPLYAIALISSSSDRYIISYFLGATAAGIYNAAYLIAGCAIFILPPLGVVLFPTVTKAYNEGNINEAQSYLKYSLKYAMMITIPSAFGLTILAKPLLAILTRPEFVAGSIVVPFVAFASLLLVLCEISSYIIYISNRTQLILGLSGTSAVLSIILNVLLIPHLGIMGAAIAIFISYAVLTLLTLMISRRYLKFDLSLPFILKSTIASAVMVLCIWLFNPASLIEVLVSMLGGALIYFSVLLVIKGLSKSEITFFLNFAKENPRKVSMLK